MRPRMKKISSSCFVFAAIAVVCSWAASTARALDPAQAPVAVRWWGQGFVTIETWWGLTVAIDPFSPEQTGYTNPDVSADLVLVTHGHFDHDNPSIVEGGPFVVRGLTDDGDFRPLNLTLDRLPNESAVKLAKTSERGKVGPHPIRIESIKSWHDAVGGAERGANAMFLIEVDGVRILHCGDLGQTELTSEQVAAIGQLDVLLLPVGGTYTVDGAAAAQIAAQLAPRNVIPIHYKTPALKFDLATVDPFLAALGDDWTERIEVGNTFAVAAAVEGETTVPTVAVLQYTPWEAPEYIKDGLAKMRESRSALAATIESLSTNQLDHKPSDGTHTVRWNGEHTAGAEIFFMSMVFKDSDESVPLIRVTPAQQPADYSPGNPDWTASEEANHLRRTGDFTERFAYLLVDVDPTEERYPAFFKSLDGLYSLMETHYGKHHTSVKKKFELADWPKD